MSWGLLFVFILTIVLIMLLSGEWVAISLGAASLIGIYVFGLDRFLSALGSIAFNSINSFTLTAVPLFILMGELITRCGVTQKFYRGITVLIGRFPGGLLHSNIVVCAFFAAISGSSVATAAAIGSIAIPEQTKRGYNRSMIFGSIGGGGTLGLLIPPSIPMIVYAVLAEESVAKLFMAGVIPGVLVAIFFILYIAVRLTLNRNLAPRFEQTADKESPGRVFLDVAPLLFLIGIIMGGIYTGIMTPTEAAALSVVVSILIGILYKGFSFHVLTESVKESIKTSCMVLFIIIGAQVLSFFFVQSGINRGLTDWILENQFSPTVFLLVMIVIYFILGCLMDGISMIYLTLPITYPIVEGLGIDPIWFGVFLVILIELGQITPPVGMNLFVLQGMSGGRPITEIIQGCVPYFFILLGSVILFMIFPEIVLWLPSTM